MTGSWSPAEQMVLLLLALLRTWAAPCQGLAFPPASCKTNWHYNENLQKCCFRCQAGHSSEEPCPQSPRDCLRLPCPTDYYLNQDIVTPRCESCVDCAPERYLVEKEPCTPYSDRVCECQYGHYCKLPVPNTCAQCIPRHSCLPGFGVKIKDSTIDCEECPPGTFSDQDSVSQPCRPHRNCTALNKVTARKGNATHDERCVDEPVSQPSVALPVDVARNLLTTSATSAFRSTAREPRSEPNATNTPDILLVKKPPRRDGIDIVSLGAALLSVLLLFTALVIVHRRRTFREWHLPHRRHVSRQAKFCAKRIPELDSAVCDPGKANPVKPEDPAEVPVGNFVLERERVPDTESDGIEMIQAEGMLPVEHPSQSHTSNRIDKIYIMRAETVIVGSASELPLGKSCPAGYGERTSEREEEIEELVMRYPEQETEFCAGSCIVTPVEEDWEFHNSSEKPVAL